jgi:Mannosyltransferase (PIG-V)
MQQHTIDSAGHTGTAPAAEQFARRLASQARTWVAQLWVRQVVGLFVASRVALLLVTYVGYVLVLAPKYSTRSVGSAGLLTSWQQWDAVWYIRIATQGYTTPDATAFFPLYPMLIATFGAPFHGQAAYAVAWIISNLATLIALLLLFRLAARHWGDAVALRAVTYLALFPTALFLFAPYNESLFLALTLGSFVALGERRWAVAGLLGGLAALTRSAGVLLLVPFAWTFWEHMRTSAGRRGLAAWRPALWALLIPAGIAGFAIFCGVRFGDPLAFTHAQASWNRVLAWPWQGLLWQVQGLLTAPAASFFQVHDLIDLAATLGFVALLVVGWRRLPRAQWLYMATLVVLTLVEPGGVHLHQNDPLSSNSRFVLEMFPGFILLGALTDDRPIWHQSAVVIFASLLAALSLVFVLGRWLV